jgi:heat shock protein beta
MKTFWLLLLGLALVAVLPAIQAEEAGSDSPAEVAREEALTADGFSDEQRKTLESGSDKMEFQAEVGRLMDIIINSLYSKKEIFLRELISNASDALDKIRFLSLTEPSLLGEGEQAKLDIRIEVDKDAKWLHITDRGVGMTRQNLIDNLGTIAKSGTSQFLESVQKGGDINLIGQFGVGFYSVYLVADRCVVTSKHNDDKQMVWESASDATFTIAEDPRGDTLGRGTRISLHLKEDAAEFLEESTIKDLIKRYSEFVSFPIYLLVTKTVDVEVPIDEEEEEKKDDEEEKAEDDDVEVKDDDDEKKAEKPKTKTVKETKKEWELLNEQKALWTRSPKDVTDEEYSKFYKALTKDYEEPLQKIHFTAEGEVEFRAILYVPKRPPSDLFEKAGVKNTNIKLFVRHVFITDEFEDLMPRYLSFIKGVVDSEDLPLNVSREMLQQSRVLKVIKKKLVTKALEMMKKLSEGEEEGKAELKEAKAAEGEEEKKDDEEEEKKDGEEEEEDEEDSVKPEVAIKEYQKFYEAFSKSIKLGIIEDSKNRKKLTKLLRYQTSKSGDGHVSLSEYVSNMKKGQKHIYYIAGDDAKELQTSPFLEKLTKRDLEVIFMTDPLDEYTTQHLDEFEDFKLMNAAKEDLRFGDKDEKKEKAKKEKAKEDFKDLIAWFKELLKDKIEKVVISSRLTETPMVLVTGQYGYTANMEKLMKAQALNDPSKNNFMAAKKTMEINPNHPIIQELSRRSKAGEEAEQEEAKALAWVLYDTAAVTAGFDLDDSRLFASRIHRMLNVGLKLDADAKVVEEAEEEEVEEEAAEEEAEEESAEAEEESAEAPAKEEL